MNTVASRVASNEKALAEYGITIRDEATGDLLSTYDILYQLSEGGEGVTKTWKEMTNAEQVSLGKTLAGVNQYKVFAAVMNNFSQAVAVTNDLMEAEGATIKQNAVYMESLEAKTSALKQQFENFVLGDGGLQQFAKILVDIGTGALQFLNSELGKTILQSLAISSAISGIVKVLGLIKASTIITSLSTIWTSLITGEGVVTALTLSMEACPLFWGALAVTEVILLVKAIDSVSDSIDKHIEKLNQASEAYTNTSNEIEGLENKLQNIQEKIKAINENKLQITDSQDLIKLQAEEASLQHQIYLLNEKARAEREEQYKEAKKVLTKVDVKETYNPIVGAYVFEEIGTVGEQLEQKSQEIIKAQERLVELQAEKQLLISKGLVEGSAGMDYQNAKITEQEQALNRLRASAVALAETTQDAVDKGDANSEVVQTNTEYLNHYYEAIGKVVDGEKQQAITDEEMYKILGLTQEQIARVTEELANNATAYENSADPITAAAIALGFVTEETEKQAQSFDMLVGQADTMRSVYETLTKAVNEYNANGVVSAQTLGQIVKLGSDYVSMLEIQNGQMVLNTKTLEAQADAWVRDAKAVLYKDAVDKINALTVADLTTDTQNFTTEINNSTVALDKYSSSIIKAANAKVSLMSGGDKKKMRELTNEIIQDTMATAQALDEMGKNMFIDIPDSRSSGGSHSTKDNTKNLYNQKFKEEKEMLDNNLQLEYISNEEYYKQLSDLIERYYGESSGVHEEYLGEYLDAEADLYKKMQTLYKKDIETQKNALKDKLSAIKEAKEIEIDQIEREIDALKDRKDAEIDEIEIQIDNLKELKEAEQDRWEAEINNLKKSNNELKSQNELLEKQEALAKAKATRVRVMDASGRFVYRQDDAAVAKAERELAQVQEEQAYEKKLEILTEFKKQANDNYQKQIDDLEKHKKDLKRQYDAQIKELENHKDEVKHNYDDQIRSYEHMIDDYEKQSERLLEGELEEISNENEVWKVRLKNIVDFVNQYNKVLSELGSGNTNVQSDYEGTTTIDTADVEVEAHAKGVAKVKSNELSLVGDNPNKELVIGSKLNGTVMSLNKGDGVVNAKSTNTLAGLLNNLGSFASSNFGNGNGILSTNNNSSSVINIGSINLPQVTNGSDFVDYLQNFALDMTQKVFV